VILASNNIIGNLANPINSQDAVTLSYLNSAISAAGSQIISNNSSVSVIDNGVAPGVIVTTIDGNIVANIDSNSADFYVSVNVGTLSLFGNTITSTGNIIIDPQGSGVVKLPGTSAVGLPSGGDVTRPAYPEIGYTRFNVDRDSIETWDGNSWVGNGAEFTITSDIINPDGVSNVFILTSNASSSGVLVNINGTIQQPVTAYNIVNNNQIQFTETPLTTDIIEVRHIAVGAVAVQSLAYLNSSVTLDGANVNVTGSLLPSANVTYDLGSSTLRWRTGYFSANTIDIGGGTIGLNDTLGFTFTTPGGTPQYMMPNGASTSNTFTSSTVTIQGNLTVAGNTTVTGNVSGQYILGSAQFLTGLPVGYSNVNTKAYTESMGFANYSNVNVAAYTQTQSYTNYSNVNVAAFVTTNGLTNYSNVNVAAFVTTNGLTNYSNVNVAAFVTTNGLTNYSNVNVAAYTQTQSYTNYSNVNLSAYLGGAVTIGGNLTVQGNLFVNGNLTTINANNLNIADSMIYLADNNPADTLDIGFVSAFTSAVRYQHTGFVRDATDGVWKLFANVIAEPTTTIDFTNANYSTLQVGNINVLGASGGLINSSGNILATGLSVFGNTRIGSLATPGALHTIIGNVDVSGAGTEYFNIGGNLIAVQGSFGSINSTGFINTSGNVSASIILAGALTSTGLINTSGNILSTGAIFNSLTVNGNITANVSGFSIGYRDLPQLTIGNVTLALTDAGKHYYSSTGAPQTLTIPSNANVAFTIGTTVVIINKSTANISVAKQSAVSLYTAGNSTNTTRTITSYGMATLVKTETDVWFINGVGLF
jgi:hypothetical protein